MMESQQDKVITAPTALAISALVTREEFSNATAYQKRQLRKRIVPLLMGVGCVLAVLGFAGLFFGRSISLSASAALCLVVLGFLMIAYDGLFAPMLDKAAAARDYDAKEDLHFATKYVFDGEAVTIENSRIQGCIPLSMLSRWSETSVLFTMAVGRELNLAIPKRLLSAEQASQLRELLKTHASSAQC